MGRSREQRQARRKQLRRNTQVRMHGWDDADEADLSHRVRCEQCASMGGAQCAQYCVLCTSMCAMVFMLFIALCSSMILLCVKLYAMS